MKKIFLSVLAVAALASCTKMGVEYEAPQEIGFKAVAGNMTKAAVDGDEFPTSLNMYVFAETTDNKGTTANYINNAEFTYRGEYDDIVTLPNNEVDAKLVWGGVTPYYWPNVNRLHFSGYSKSGNVSSAINDVTATVQYTCGTSKDSEGNEDNKLSITNYTPGTGDNDLMWFPNTKLNTPNGYLGKDTRYVVVDMYHTCSWISFMVKGDAVTGVADDESTDVDESLAAYVIDSLKINGIDIIANVACSASKTDDAIVPSIVWTNNTAADASYDVTLNANATKLTQTAKNIETNAIVNTSGNIIVIPQTPGVLELKYSYKSSTGATITDEYSVAKGNALSLAINTNSTLNKWLPGVHYIYTITIKANEILIAPTPGEWDSNDGFTVTVE